MTDLLVAGALYWDTRVTTSRLPAPGETGEAKTLTYGLGGTATLQAVAAARMGARVTLAAAIGTDDAGLSAMEALTAARIPLRAIQEVGGQTGVQVSLFDQGPAPRQIISPGANANLTSSQISVPGGLKVLLLHGDTDADITDSLIARAAGVEVIINATPAGPLAPRLLRRANVVIANRTEAAALAGRRETAEIAARAILDQGAKAVIVTKGAEGCILALPGAGITAFPAHRITPISTYGAADGFCGAFAASRAMGMTLDRAIRRAQAYAALIVATTPGERQAIAAEHVDQLVGAG